MVTRIPLVLAAILLISAALCSGCGGTSSDTPASDATQDASDDTLLVDRAWLRPAPEGGVTALYLEVRNRRATADTLTRVETPVSNRTELHETVLNDNGTTGMRPLEHGLPLPPDTTTMLHPGGPHLMVYNVQPALTIGDSVQITLHFGDLERAITARVRPTPPQ